MFTTVRSLVAADAASFLRTMGARCAARQLEKVAVGVRLCPSEWDDVRGDAATVARRAPSAERLTAHTYANAIEHLSHNNGVGDDLALHELARHDAVSPDEWLDTARQSATVGEAVSL